MQKYQNVNCSFSQCKLKIHHILQQTLCNVHIVTYSLVSFYDYSSSIQKNQEMTKHNTTTQVVMKMMQPSTCVLTGAVDFEVCLKC